MRIDMHDRYVLLHFLAQHVMTHPAALLGYICLLLVLLSAALLQHRQISGMAGSLPPDTIAATTFIFPSRYCLHAQSVRLSSVCM